MKIPTPRKLPSGSWNIRMRLNGENISVTRSSRKQCIHAAEEIKSAYHNGKWTKEKKVEEKTIEQILDLMRSFTFLFSEELGTMVFKFK